jgi:hypothetical protein
MHGSLIDKAASNDRQRTLVSSKSHARTHHVKQITATTQPTRLLTLPERLFAMSGFESLADVTLRPWPAAKKEELSPQDLLLQIEQLGNERGHLRDVTEKSLQEDIVAGKHAPEGSAGESEQKKKRDTPSKEARLQEVLKMQYEMSQHME